MTGAAKADIEIEKEITVMVTMSKTYKVKLETLFSRIGNVYAIDSSLLMGDPLVFLEEDYMTKLQKDHLMILLESMDSKMQITVEAVGSLNDKIDGVERRLNTRIDNIDSILQVTIGEVAALHKKVDAVDKKIDAVDKKVDAVYEELVAHRSDTELHKRQTKRPLKKVA